MTAIFCKLICGLARGKHHRLQMLKSFQVQRGGKANPEPGTVATERSDAYSSAASALVWGGAEMTGRFHCSGSSRTLQSLESHSGEWPWASGENSTPLWLWSVPAWNRLPQHVYVCVTQGTEISWCQGGKHLLAWGGQHTQAKPDFSQPCYLCTGLGDSEGIHFWHSHFCDILCCNQNILMNL